MELTHIDGQGNAVMVDVGEKTPTARLAEAQGTITMNRECFLAVKMGTAKKGDVLGVAQVAGIMAAKHTADMIPLCHRLNLTSCSVKFELQEEPCVIVAVCAVGCRERTGVEMEALTGVTAALLTIYDMCKAIDREMVIGDIHLLEKQGGRSGHFRFGAHDD